MQSHFDILSLVERLSSRKAWVLSYLQFKLEEAKLNSIQRNIDMYSFMLNYYMNLYEGFPTDIPDDLELVQEIKGIIEKSYDLQIFKMSRHSSADEAYVLYEEAFKKITKMNMQYLKTKNQAYLPHPSFIFFVDYMAKPLLMLFCFIGLMSILGLFIYLLSVVEIPALIGYLAAIAEIMLPMVFIKYIFEPLDKLIRNKQLELSKLGKLESKLKYENEQYQYGLMTNTRVSHPKTENNARLSSSIRDNSELSRAFFDSVSNEFKSEEFEGTFHTNCYPHP